MIRFSWSQRIGAPPLLSLVVRRGEETMKSLSPAILGFLSCLLGVPALFSAEEATLIPPVVTWEGGADRNLPAAGPHEIKVLSNAKAFQDRWKVWRPNEEAPSVNFADYFAVEVVQPGGDYTLFGLLLDERGMASVNGVGALQAVDVPKGFGYTIAIFPRKGVKTVDGRDLPADK